MPFIFHARLCKENLIPLYHGVLQVLPHLGCLSETRIGYHRVIILLKLNETLLPKEPHVYMHIIFSCISFKEDCKPSPGMSVYVLTFKDYEYSKD